MSLNLPVIQPQYKFRAQEIVDNLLGARRHGKHDIVTQ